VPEVIIRGICREDQPQMRCEPATVLGACLCKAFAMAAIHQHCHCSSWEGIADVCCCPGERQLLSQQHFLLSERPRQKRDPAHAKVLPVLQSSSSATACHWRELLMCAAVQESRAIAVTIAVSPCWAPKTENSPLF